MDARRHRGSAGGQRLRAALVRAETPAARRGVIDRSSHERVAEAETTRNVGMAHEVAAQQLVERRECGRLRDCRRRSHQLGLERVARDGRALQYEARAVRQQPELLGQCGDDGGRNPAGVERDLEERGGGARCSILRARELLEVERIATAVLVERGGRGIVEAGSEKLPGLGQRQGPELVTREPSGPVRALEGGRKTAWRLAGPHRHREQDGGRRQAAEKRAEQLDRPRVGPVQVVQDQHERLARQPASPAGRAPRGGCGSARPAERRRRRCRAPRARGTRARAPCAPSRPAAPAVVDRVPRRTRRARRRRPRTAGRARARRRSR